ncbi:MAG TPA: ATP-binding protein [Burkholderiales bacterium]|jgi:PAS domain S-box-containing protein|nr:ATP-binding protein [Burkholderiales bacterium]
MDVSDRPGEGASLQLLRERCDFAYRRLVPAAGGTLAVSVILSAFLWRSEAPEVVMSWQALMVVLAMFVVGLAWAYRRAHDRAEQAATWARRLAIGAAALGAGWGYGAAVFFPGSVDHQVFLSFIVALVTAGALPIFSTLWWVYAIYAGAVMLPFNVVLFSHGTEFLRLLGAAVPLLYVANVITAYELGRAFLAAYGLRTAYQRLSADNAEIQAQLAEQLDSLLDAHREVQAAGRKLRLFSERAPISVFELDPGATILDMNPAAENLFGYAAPELVGRSWIAMVLGPEERVRAQTWWPGFVAAGKPVTLIAEQCLRRDGLELACEWTLTPLSDEEGRVNSIVLQGRDITQARAAERMRSEFTSTLSHELRTPLTSILGSLQLLRSGALGDMDRDQGELVEVAERNGQRLLDLINEVLDIEKIESGRLTLMPEPMPIDSLLNESVRLNQGYADRFRANLALHGAVPGVIVRADRKRLMQVMTNLLSNAAKFSPPNSAVDVSVSRPGDTVRVEVSDRGPGIPEAFRSKIFGRFAQADSADSRIKGGTGLGLAISKRLIELMQGRIGFEDRPGGGTTFFFELPVLSSAEGEADSAVRVLLTEPDSVTAEYLTMVLERAGYRVDPAPDAGAVGELLERWSYGAWLLARRLEGVDTLALLEELRPRLRETRVIMLAGLTSDEAGVVEPQRHGIADWLSKADSRARILEVVDHATGRVAS